MRMQTRLALAGLALLGLSAHAQVLIAAPNPSSRTSWDLFSEPGAATPARQVSLGELTFPLVVRETRSSHHRIEVQGQPFWIKSVQTTLVRGSTAACSKGVKESGLTASTAGVGKNGCP